MAVPGDFTLVALDSVLTHPKIKYVGCVNELNASYAADGYARVSQGLGVTFFTFGPGEMSACNGIAGAFSERVPILNIVGVPSTGLQTRKALLHHTLGDGRFDAYQNVYKQITVAQASINKPQIRKDGSDVGDEIDRVITTALIEARPTYLTLPTDLVAVQIPRAQLDKPITMESIKKSLAEPKVSQKVEGHIIAQICSMYKQAKKPIVLVDACAIRFSVQGYCQQLVEKTGMPFFTTPMGKTALDETNPLFGGIYVGDITRPSVREAVESADFILYVGSLKSDFNTASFSFKIPPERSVELHSDHTLIQYAQYPNAGFRSLLPKLIPELEAVASSKSSDEKVDVPSDAGMSAVPGPTNSTEMMKQDDFSGDVIVSETGTSNFGILDVRLPSKTTLTSQVLYGSIGWACGATLGAAMAAQEQGRRCILFTGDGSIQLTVQELSTMIRHGVKPILVVLNNDGYVIERLIHGMEAPYNTIGSWAFQDLLRVLGAKPDDSHSYLVKNRHDLEALFNNAEFAKADKIQLVEVLLGPQDAPRALREQAALTEKANAEID
ncbi:hypothetical protein EMMF5_002529 [Cystobasidiomycetes sp. EMM_F5]